MTALEVVSKAEREFTIKSQVNMTKYIDTGNMEYLGQSRAYAEAARFVKGLVVVPGKEQK